MYWDPIEAKLDAWLARYPGDPVADAVARAEREEMAFYRAHAAGYGYEFYLMRRDLRRAR